MARLPIPGGDNNTWGVLLNEYLAQSHNTDGTLKTDAIQAAAPDATSGQAGTIQLTGDLGGSASSPTVVGLQGQPVSGTTPTDGQVLVYSTSGGHWLPQTGGGSYTNENAQDAVGTILTDTSSVDFTYDDNTPSITAAVLPAGVDKNSLGGSALTVANGGTGATSFTSGNVLTGAGTGAITASKTAPTGAFVGTTDSQTLTNKTLTTPVISSISNIGTITLPTSTDTLVGRDTTDTLTNKTITATTNTITANSLRTASGAVSVSAATAPSAGQILRATSGTVGTWQDLSATNTSFSNSTSGYTATTVQAAIDENAGLLMTTGTLAARPTAATAGSRALYYATDDSGGTLYRSNGSTWQQIGAPVNQSSGAELARVTLSSDHTNESVAVEAQLTGFSLSVTVGSRPIAIEVYGDIIVGGSGTDTDGAGFLLKRDGTLHTGFLPPPVTRTGGSTKSIMNNWMVIDAPAAGSYTYTLHIQAGTTAKWWKALAANALFGIPAFTMAIVER